MAMRDQLAVTLASKLRAAMKDSGLSSTELAKETGVAVTVIGNFIRGKDLGIHQAEKIIAYFGGEVSFPLECEQQKAPTSHSLPAVV